MRSFEDDLAAWRREFPELATDALSPILCACSLAEATDLFRRRVLEPFEISTSEYDVLAALRQFGPPYRMNPTMLSERLDRSSGGMTKLIKRLEAGAYVERIRNPDDGRGSLVLLTRRGLDLQARVLAAFVAAAGNRLEGLPAARLVEICAAIQEFCEALEH